LPSVLSSSLILGSAFLATPASAQGKGRHASRAERHPEIDHALKALENAKKFLVKADRDFGGHRTKAVQAVDDAISECNQAIEFDKH
jgi:hypothetical protein